MSNNLGWTAPAGGQGSGIFTTMGDGLAALDAALTDNLTVAVTTTTPSLTAAQFKGASLFFLVAGSPAPGSAVTLTVPVVTRGMFIVKNDTGQAVTVEHSGASPSGPSVADGAIGLFFTDGTTVYKV